MAILREVRHIGLDDLVLSPQQARTRDVEKDLDELVDSIRVQGQLEPILVVPCRTVPGKFEIVAGQRRWLAMRRLGAGTIHAAILDDDVDEVTAQAISVSENMVRRDLSGKDLIDICTRLYHRYGTVKAVAQELGLPYNKVRSYVKFDRLRPDLKRLVESGRLDIKTAIRIEDHYGDDEIDPRRLSTIADAVAGMTNAQKADYLKDLATEQERQPMPQVNGAPRRAPGSVRQILVTLRGFEVDQLRQWAKDHHLTQDAAAGQILRAHLRRLAGENRRVAE